MKTKSLTVEWIVKCEIGPDWIGGGRSICFYLDNNPLGDTNLHQELKDQLIKKINIPSESEKYIIKGEGNLKIENLDLIIEYSTESNIPYDTEVEFHDGKEVLYSGV